MVASGGVPLIKLFENMFPGIFVHADAVVTDDCVNTAGDAGKMNVDLASLVGKLDGIADQIDPDLQQQ